MMKFELLPIEILIECFEYLDGLDILHSFNQLNNRFNKLIRNLPLNINFQHVRKANFCQFCRQISSDPEMIKQICSLYLSNKDTSGQIKAFLSVLKVDEYPNLHSLTLINVEEENVCILQSMLPFCSKLQSFHLISPEIDEDAIISALPISNLQNLSITSLRSFLRNIDEPTIITHLTILNCCLDQLFYQLFKYVPMLKYLHIECISKYNRSIKMLDQHNAVHLKELVIDQFKYRFEDFSNFVKQIPNLENLTIICDYDIEMLNANRWKLLITSSLPLLNIFKFKFNCHRNYKDFVIFNLNQFQTDFWIKQHQWYTQVLFHKFSLTIHTIPYPQKTFKLELNSRHSSNELGNLSKTFDKVNYLTLVYQQITEKCLHYFPNLMSLKIVIQEQQIVDSSILHSLNMISNLSNLKHLDITESPRLIFEGQLLSILKESSQLSSLTINPKDLTLLLSDSELSKYLNKMIKKLNIYKHDYPAFVDLDQTKMFLTTFSNVEHLKCSINQLERILFLLCRLSKLTKMFVYLSSISNTNHFRHLLEKAAETLKFMFSIKYLQRNAAELYIWIDETSNKHLFELLLFYFTKK